MGKHLFITEKPSVAMEFAKALGVSGGREDGRLENEQYIITWCVGHLISMCYPEEYDPGLKEWKLETLPFIPQNYRYGVIPGVKKQYQIVAGLLNRKDVDAIYYSGDSAREGEYIQRLVRQMAGHNRNAAEYRVWIDSQTEEEIQRGIREAKPLAEYDKLAASAYARAIEDYLIGMNFSRVLSLKYARRISNAVGESYHPIAVGRVMSCVLGLVVSRERQIRNTRIISYYSIRADLCAGVTADWKITDESRYKHTPENYNDIGLLDKIPVEDLLTSLKTKGTLRVKEVSSAESKRAAPLLFNLAELQAECARLYKISPSQTLQTAQQLYEKKLTTYPRTDARVLTKAVVKAYEENIRGLSNVPELSSVAENVLNHGLFLPSRMEGTKYVDDSKVSDHYAIIPTGQTGALTNLTDLEREVYFLIARRFLSIFYPPAVYERASCILEGEGESFAGSVTRLVSPGYLEVTGYDRNEMDDKAYRALMSLKGTVPASFVLTSGKSKPPKRYTTGSMILAMENAGSLIEDASLREQIKSSGIGTSATRADVIAKLEKNQYIRIEKKNQSIHAAPLGEMIYDVLSLAIPQILNPVYTASWEKGLAGITDGTISKEHYLERISHYVSSGVEAMKKADHSQELDKSIGALKEFYPDIRTGSPKASAPGYACPYCGKAVLENSKGYYCSGYRDGCAFSVWKTVAGKTLPEPAVRVLIETFAEDAKGEYRSSATGPVNGFQSRSGKSFNASLRLAGKRGERPRLEFC